MSSSSAIPFDTIVLGGGLAGLASAALAAKRGERVLVLERGPWGGKCQRWQIGDHTIDSGPAVFSLPAIWQMLWQRLQQADPIRLIPISGLGRHHWRGEYLDLDHNLSSSQALTHLSAADQQAWQHYSQDQKLDLVQLLSRPPRLYDPAFLKASTPLWRYTKSARQVLQRYQLPALLEESLAIHSLNAGIGSQYASGLYAALPALMLSAGLSVPEGGMYSLVLSLLQACHNSGVQLKSQTNVTALDTKQRTLITDNGRSYQYQRLISAIDEQRLSSLQGLRVQPPNQRTCSGVALYFVLEEELDLPASSVILPPNPLQLEADLWAGRLPSQTMAFVKYYPTGPIYPHNTRPILAILLTTPANGQRYHLHSSWVQQQLQHLKRTLGWPNLPTHAEVCLHPHYFAEAGAWGGALYGRCYPRYQSGPFHPIPHQNGRIFRVGTSVHPGGGIPGVIGSALMVDTLMK